MLSNYSFTRPLTSTGKPTRYISVLSFLNKVGSVNRYEILRDVMGIENAVTNKDWYRGHMSSMFADMRRSGIVTYSNKTRKWSITQKGADLLERAKLEWGRRYAESYWN